MKRSFLNFLSCIIFMMSFAVGYGNNQQEKDDCLQQVKAIYKNMGERVDVEGGKVFHLKCTIETTPGNRYGEEKHRTDIELYAKKDTSILISKEVEVYQNENTSISIIPDKKTIYLADYDKKIKDKGRFQTLFLLQDKLFDLSTVEYCDYVKLEDGKEYKKVRLNIQNGVQRKHHIESMEFLLDERENMMKKACVNYDSNYAVRQRSVMFHAIEYNCETKKLDKEILSFIFNEKGELLSHYKDYQIIDIRKRK